MVILLGFALLSGIVTILSPCILPILPIVLSTATTGQRARPLGLIVGLIFSFSVFTLLVTRLVAALGISANSLRLVSVVILVLIGLTMIIPAWTLWLEKLLSFLPGLVRADTGRGNGFWPGALTGVSLGLIWAPCAGPILSAVIIVAATQTLTLNSALVIFAFSIGSGIPMLIVAYGGRAIIQRVRLLAGNLQRIQQVFGVIVILTAALIAFNVDTLLTAWATDFLPSSFTSALNGFENNPAIQNQLAALRGGTTSLAASGAVELQDGGPAKDFTGGTNWINSPPLTLSSLKGTVVLVDFWTYSCINCIRTFPYLRDWYAKYKDYGFTIIGVHAPEFAFEHDTGNVDQAVKQFGILYPVVQDNNYAIWNAYQNIYWPAEYLIDAAGEIRHIQYGEGNYDRTEEAIQALLAEAGHPVNTGLAAFPTAQFSSSQTPEIYIGTARRSLLDSTQPVVAGSYALYYLSGLLPINQFAVAGYWDFEPQFAQNRDAGAQLQLHFFARDAYLVMTSAQPATVTVTSLTPNVANGSEDVDSAGRIMVRESRLYHLVHFDKAMEGEVILRFDTPGVEIYSFTFGG